MRSTSSRVTAHTAIKTLVALGMASSVPLMADAIDLHLGSKVPPLQPYVLPDRTAMIRLPADWKVVQTGVAFIRAQGPNGELAMFGIAVPAHDGGGPPLTPAGINQPYSADLGAKFTQSLSWVLTQLGRNGVPIKLLSNTPFKAPPQFGSCANFTMLLGPQGGIAAEADFCSLPEGPGGGYQNFFKIVGIGSARAKVERKMLEAILGSYQLNLTAIRQQQAAAGNAGAAQNAGAAPVSPQPQPQPQGSTAASLQQQQLAWQLAQMQTNAIMSSTNYAMQSSLQAADTFDRSVLRGETPVYADGGTNPIFWLSD